MDINQRYVKLIAENVPVKVPRIIFLLLVPIFGLFIGGLIYSTKQGSYIYLAFLIPALLLWLSVLPISKHFTNKAKKQFLEYYQEHNALPPWSEDGKWIIFSHEKDI